MIDMIRLIQEKIFRRPPVAPGIAGEDISEKSTSKLGNMLLVCMFLAIIGTTQWSASIIKSIPERPDYSSISCYIQLGQTFNSSLERGDSFISNYFGEENCGGSISIGSSYENIPDKEYANIAGISASLQELHKEYQAKENGVYSLKNQLREFEYKYSQSLTEKIASEENGVYDKDSSKQQIQNINKMIEVLESEKQELANQAKKQIQENLPQIRAFISKTEVLENEYNSRLNWYKFYVGLLNLILTGTVFGILYRIYSRLKRENSPNTIILSTATFAYGLVLLQILLVFLYEIIPHRLLNLLIDFFTLFEPLLFLVQFIWPVIVIGVFGYFVHRIQKRIYSPENRLKRFIGSELCPNCENTVDISKPFCPLCSHEIQIHCPHCKELTIKGLPYCSSCGKKISESK